MKKKILLFSSSILLLSASLMSNDNGPISAGNGNRSGSKNSSATCSGGGCHSANSSSTIVTIALLDTNNVPVTNGFEHGVTYKIALTGGNLTMTKYGFQLSTVSGIGGSQIQAGTFGTAPAGTAVKSASSLSILEHTAPLNITSGTFSTVINWTAPADTTIDTVKFYATVNAVNDNNAASGDQPNKAAVSYFKKLPASVGTLNADIKIATYPNPVTDKLNISLENAENGTYTIRVFDMNGKVVANQSANVTKSFSTSINATAWANGMYHVQLLKDGAQRTIAVMKQ